MSREGRNVTAIVLLFLCLGLVFLFSASAVMADQSPRYGDSAYFLKRQGLWSVIALTLFFFATRIPVAFWRRTRLPLFGAAVLLLALVLVPGIGVTINGARRWLHAAGWFFQPSEFAKLACAVFVCGHLASDPSRIVRFRDGFVPPFAAVLLCSCLIVVEPDLGTAAFLGLTMVLTMIVAGIRWRHLIPPALAGGAAIGAYVATHLSHVGPRLQTWLNPDLDPLGKGHQIRQSLLAFGAGGLWGAGLGRGAQKLFFLPEVHSDFIFPVIAEELGFLGSVSVLLLYVAFGAAGWRILRKTDDPFGSLLAFSLTLFIVLQAAFNLMVVTAMVPTKGIPLPFLSFGGSSLCFTLVSAGILVRIADEAASPPAPEPAA